MKTYIYKLENCYNDPKLTYVGKTIDPNRRLKEHRKTYGCNTKMIILDEVDSLLVEDWLPLESKWISIMKQTHYTPLNQNNGGGGSNGKTYPIIAKNMNGDVVKWYPNIQEASIHLGIKTEYIRHSIKHKTQSAGYYWVKDIDVKWPDHHIAPSVVNEWVFRA